jgi:hypothetical protein
VQTDHTRHVLQVSDHHRVQQATARSATVRHDLRVIVRSLGHVRQVTVLQVIAPLATVHHAQQATAHSATDHHALPVTVHLVVLQAVRHVAAPWVALVAPAVQAAVDSIVVPSAAVSVAQSPAAGAVTLANAAIALTAKAQFVAQMRPRATARDVAKGQKAANLAR